MKYLPLDVKQPTINQSKFCTKHFSRVLTSVKDSIQEYCYEIYSISGVNQMWILKKDLLLSLRPQSLQCFAT